MVRADFYNGPKIGDYIFQGSVSMDLPRITNRFMQAVLYALRSVEEFGERWCYLYVDDEYVGIVSYSDLFENYIFVNRGSDNLCVHDRRRVGYDRKAV